MVDHPPLRRLAALSIALSLWATTAQAVDADDWRKSQFGPADEIGAAKLLSPQFALEAARLVKATSMSTTPTTRTASSCRPTA